MRRPRPPAIDLADQSGERRHQPAALRRKRRQLLDKGAMLPGAEKHVLHEIRCQITRLHLIPRTGKPMESSVPEDCLEASKKLLQRNGSGLRRTPLCRQFCRHLW